MLNLIDHLPPTSYYTEALATDQELAQSLADQDIPEGKQRFSQWSPELGALAHIADLLCALINVQRVAIQNDPVKFEPYPRPKTALAELIPIRRREQHESLVARLTPKE